MAVLDLGPSWQVNVVDKNSIVLTATDEQPEPDERLIDHVTRIDDFCRRLEVDATSVIPEVEGLVRGAYELREAAKDLNQRERRVVGDALGRSIREVMS